MITVQKQTVGELTANLNFWDLLEEYAEESALEGLPPPGQKFEMYRLMEASGTFHCFGAYDGDQLVGFVALLTPVIPHYGVSVGVTESLFAAKVHRKKGVGLKLLRTAEKFARDAGCPAIMVSAPAHGALVRVLQGLEYAETNRVFTKVFKHG